MKAPFYAFPLLAILNCGHTAPKQLSAPFIPDSSVLLDILWPCTGGDRIADFVCEHRLLAVQASKATGVPATYILAHAGAESGWGRHAPQNNFFGHKAAAGTGAHYATTECKNGACYATTEEFAVYATPEAAFERHAVLLNSDRYRPALKYTNTPDRYFETVARLGYATAEPENYGRYMATVVQSVETRWPR